MPASCRIAGLTKTMYAIVMNVVKPARISVRQSAFSAANSKYRSSDARRDMKFHCRRRPGKLFSEREVWNDRGWRFLFQSGGGNAVSDWNRRGTAARFFSDRGRRVGLRRPLRERRARRGARSRRAVQQGKL